MRFFGFKGGIHPPENKIQTENKAIEELEAPKMLNVPLLQHIGVPLSPIVKVGERVLKGQMIANNENGLGAPVHSPVSGTVKKIESLPIPTGVAETIVIENDGQHEWVEVAKNPEWNRLSSEKLIEIIRNSGIVGLGGAGFPTHAKLSFAIQGKVETLILNGAECEPYLNSDNRLMIEKAEQLIEGIQIIGKVLGVKEIFVGIEDNKKEAIDKLTKLAENTEIVIAPLETKYPQGGEKSLIKAIINKEVPSRGLPSAVGAAVVNTTSAIAVYEAVVEGKPLIDKVVTVSGKGVKNPRNVNVAIGTPLSYILEKCGFEEEKTQKVVMGGPMMGISQYTLDVPVVKGTSGLLALTKEETNECKPKACIGCGKCVDACPMSLEPLMYARLAQFSQWEDMSKYHLMDCIECGSCAYICPSNRPLTEAIKLGKAKLRSMGK